MKINNEPVSAFEVYSKRFKQKKKSKTVLDNGIKKLGKPQKQNNDLKSQQVKEIGSILKKLSEQSSRINVVENRTEGNTKLKLGKSEPEGKRLFSKNFTREKVNGTDIQTYILPMAKASRKKHKSPMALFSKKEKKCFETKNKSGNFELEQNSFPKEPISENIVLGPLVNMSPEIHVSGISLEKNTTTNKKFSKKLKSKKNIIPNSLKNKAINNDSEHVKLKVTSTERSSTISVVLNGTENAGNSVEQENQLLPNKKIKHNKKQSKTDIVKNKSNNSIDSDWMNQKDSILAGKRLFEWLILPIFEKDFMRDYWEKQPLLVQRENNRNYFSELLSTPAIDTMLRENVVYFTKHLDVTSYADGVRETHNVSGRAQPNVVWDFYSNGCSIRLLNPQAFLPKIHILNATLQDYFGCFVGANVYLTPPNSQGFAPHYDDIEAFVLQIEGKKHWKVYPPRNDKETLPRYSSPNFSQEEIGEPFLDVILEPGDMLYFPRGYIHQAFTVKGEHSLHITLSAYQKTAWVDLFEKMLPLALKRAAEENVEFRKGLPRDYLNIEHHGRDADKVTFMDTAQRLMSTLGNYLGLSLGSGVDQLGSQFMHDALPPVFTSEEKQNSSLGSGLIMKENGKLTNRVEFEMDTEVKLIRANICRLVEEEGEVRLYHCLDNPLEYHGDDPQFLVLPQEGIPVITFLARNYPNFVNIKKIPHEDEEVLITLVSDLWDAGLLVTQGLQPSSEVVNS